MNLRRCKFIFYMPSFLLLGAGELAKEFIIAAQRFAFTTIAVDRYENAPAMQVAHFSEVINMLDPKQLDDVVYKYKPDYIVPEIEAICVEKLAEFEAKGMTVVPCAKAVEITMNRKKTRDLAVELGLETAQFSYAYNIVELYDTVYAMGFPCVVKPFMSSSGKGQSIVKIANDIRSAWEKAVMCARGDTNGVIVEKFIHFTSEITLLTVTKKTDNNGARNNSSVSFCNPIGHRQENGDYQESWQPHLDISVEQYRKAKSMAHKIVTALGGFGIWGVEFFLLPDDEILFSELSPRPHDTGMVTMVTQWQNEFELHLRAILGWNINTKLRNIGASHALVSLIECSNSLDHRRIDTIVKLGDNVDVRIFGKPTSHIGRRMGVVLAWDPNPTSLWDRDPPKVCEDECRICINCGSEVHCCCYKCGCENCISPDSRIKVARFLAENAATQMNI
jgi:phosphoribosylglycinamide formyltransferase 2